jgi:hypothetical protein
MRKVLTDEIAIEYFPTDVPLKIAAREIGCGANTLKDTWERLYGKEAYVERKRRLKSIAMSGENHWAYGKTGRDNPFFKEDARYLGTQGYWVVKAPEWWTGNTGDGLRVLEHRVVCAEKLGLTAIPDSYEVHHMDENKLNNSPENLYMMHKYEHARLHMEGRLKEKVQRLSREGVGSSDPKRLAPSNRVMI